MYVEKLFKNFFFIDLNKYIDIEITKEMEETLVFSTICGGVFAILLLISFCSKSKRRKETIETKLNTPTQSITKNRKTKKFLQYSSHRVHRPSLMDTGMEIILPWKHDEQKSTMLTQSVKHDHSHMMETRHVSAWTIFIPI